MDAQPTPQEHKAAMTEPDAGPAKGEQTGRGAELACALQSHDRLLRSAVQARLGEPQAVDEIMQEVALAAVKNAERSAPPANPGGWLYRVALRCVLLYRRSRGRQSRLHEGYGNDLARQAAETAGPLECLLRAERETIVQRALASLGEADREILLGKYSDGLSYRELAERLAISETAVETRLHRARQRLREAVVQFSGDEESNQ